MLILAGVSISAIVGDNGIISKAQEVNYLNSCAILEEFIQDEYFSLYVENDYKNSENMVEDLIDQRSNYFYIPYKEGVGNLKYIVDANGHALYLIKKSELPEDIKNQIKGGEAGNKTFSDYASLNDVYGVTKDLRVYYSDSNSKMYYNGSTLALDFEEEREIFASDKDKEYYDLLSKYDKNGDGIITSEELKSLKSLVISSDSGITSLEALSNFPSLKELTLNAINLTSLKGIQYAYRITNLTFSGYSNTDNINIDDYKEMENLKYLNTIVLNGSCDKQVTDVFNVIKEANYSNVITIGVYNGGVNVTNISVDIMKDWNNSIKSTLKNAYFYANNLDNIEFLKQYTNVEDLRVNNNAKITTLKPCENMNNIKSLYAYACDLQDNSEKNEYALSAFMNKTQLSYVNLQSNVNLKYLDGLKNCPLKYFYLNGCTSLLNAEITKVGNLWTSCYRYYTNLNSKYYNFLRCDEAKIYLNVLDKNGNNIYGDNSDGSVMDLYDLAVSTNQSDKKLKEKVKSIWIAGHSELTNAQLQTILTAFPNVMSINVDGCTNLTSLDFVNSLNELVEISFNNTGVTGNISQLENCTKMKNLSCNNEAIILTSIPKTLSRLRRDHSSDGYCFYVLGGTRIGNLAGQFVNFNSTNCQDLTHIELTGISYNGTIDLSNITTKIDLGFPDYSIKEVILSPYTGKTRFTTTVAKWNFSNCISIDNFSPESWNANWIAELISQATYYGIQIKEINIAYMGFTNNWLCTLDLKEYGAYNPNNKTIGEIINWLGVCNPTALNLGMYYGTKSEDEFAPSISSTYVYDGNLNTLDFSASGWSNLKYFSAHDCVLNNLNFLKNCYSLRVIYAPRCSINDISGIEDCTQIIKLYLQENEIYDITVLSKLQQLQLLNVEYNSLYSTLIKDGVTVSNIDTLVKLNKYSLKKLYIDANTGITDYSRLSSCSWDEKTGF